MHLSPKYFYYQGYFNSQINFNIAAKGVLVYILCPVPSHISKSLTKIFHCCFVALWAVSGSLRGDDAMPPRRKARIAWDAWEVVPIVTE